VKPTTQRHKERLFLDLQPYISSLAEDGMSIRQIADYLNGSDIPSYTGKPWNTRSVQEALASLDLKTANQ